MPTATHGKHKHNVCTHCDTASQKTVHEEKAARDLQTCMKQSKTQHRHRKEDKTSAGDFPPDILQTRKPSNVKIQRRTNNGKNTTVRTCPGNNVKQAVRIKILSCNTMLLRKRHSAAENERNEQAATLRCSDISTWWRAGTSSAHRRQRRRTQHTL